LKVTTEVNITRGLAPEVMKLNKNENMKTTEQRETTKTETIYEDIKINKGIDDNEFKF